MLKTKKIAFEDVPWNRSSLQRIEALSESELVFCSLPVVQDGYVISVTSSCEENPYCDGAELLYGCDFGKLPGTASKATCSGGSWTPLPACAS